MTPLQFIRALRREFGNEPVYVARDPHMLSRDRDGTWTETEKASLLFCVGPKTDVVALATFADPLRRDGMSVEIMGGSLADRQQVAKLVDKILSPVGVEEW